MGIILEKTVDRAISKKYFPASDKAAIITKIEQMCSKYGVSPDDFAKITHVESYGMDPKAGCAGGSYYGFIQIGGAVMGEIGTSKSQLCSVSALDQLTIVDKYLGLRARTGFLKSGADLPTFYLAILFPALANTSDYNKALSIPKQADALYNSAGQITKTSLQAGLNLVTQRALGGVLPPSQAASAATETTLPGDYAAPIGNAVQGAVTGLISAVFSKVCTEQFPINFTLREAISYVGCKTKLASAQMAGGGLGYPPQAMQVPGASATGLGGTVPGTPVCAGCFIWPVDKKFPTTSPRTQNRNGRPHNGTDIGCPDNTPVLAAGDGKVVSNTFDGRGYGNYITIEHPNGLFTRYAHLSAPGIAQGTSVKQGQVIGKSGHTGVGSGPHLHFEVLRANTFGRAGYKDTLEPSQYCKKT